VGSIGTDWIPFDRSDVAATAALLAGILDRTADAWLVVEPRPSDEGGSRLRKAARSPYSATISPMADDDEPHIMVYVVFPKGARFVDRGIALPTWVQLDDTGKDDATVRVPHTTDPAEVVRLALTLLEGCAGTTLGQAWQGALGDTFVGGRNAWS
jgi:hypothetical protein